MILVNNSWEQVYDLQDVSQIVRENYNRDLADELDKLIPIHTDEEYEKLEMDFEDAQEEIDSLECEIDQLQEKLDMYETECE